MIAMRMSVFLAAAGIFLFVGCKAHIDYTVDRHSAKPGDSVTLLGSQIRLTGKPIAVGSPLPSVKLLDAGEHTLVDLSSLKGSVLFLNIVSSLDTKVCEAQTHYLGKQGGRMPPQVKRIVISRDSPFAQMRFAQEAKLEHLLYLSDQARGAFGKATGLLMQNDLMLDTRAVIVADRGGVVRYIQVVPEITHLPDMETAFQRAEELAR
jgi:thiol peroxidase